MRDINRFYFFAALICCLFSCQSDKKGIDVIDGIENDIQVEMIEQLGSDDARNLTFHCYTLDEYGCRNTYIPFQLDQNPYAIDINLSGIALPEDCLEGYAPAAAMITLQPLLASSYLFSVSLREVIRNEGVLSVYSDRYQIKMDNTKGLIFVNKTLMKIPPQTIWGYVVFNNEQDNATAAAFRSEIEALTSPLVPAEGDYGYFVIDQEGRVSISSTADYPVQQSFYYKNEGNKTEEISEVLSEYRSAYPHMTFKIFTSSGETL